MSSACLRAHRLSALDSVDVLWGHSKRRSNQSTTSIECSELPIQELVQTQPKLGVNRGTISVNNTTSGNDLPSVPHKRSKVTIGPRGHQQEEQPYHVKQSTVFDCERLPLKLSNSVTDPTGGQFTHLMLGDRAEETVQMRTYLVTMFTACTQLAQVGSQTGRPCANAVVSTVCLHMAKRAHGTNEDNGAVQRLRRHTRVRAAVFLNSDKRRDTVFFNA